ncbi:carcinoembryonic antigen-related cell adhesion molecule 5-like isoform X2 [Sparus aurata]|uniref:carcinoembryonic antigen-related cell adhesion molecule 5-like isoform X2 n=1 Tax=Sparus aurata TaxID=8175 RepID=UPI0011C0F5B8|nr:carcinoembryonic antigen-related cell adhesion molecule 5-like isoform X2 [Sparus aurata]
MELLPLLCVVSVAFTGLTKGAGVLPDGPLNAAVGGKVMFNATVIPPARTFSFVQWQFKDIVIINTATGVTAGYAGRVTLFDTTGSLELRNLVLSDSGEYNVVTISQNGSEKSGNTTLEVYVPLSNVMVTPSSTDLVEFNSSVSLSCSASGTSPSFLWLNSSSEVTQSDRVQVTDEGANLTIVNVTRFDQGPFSCNVSNPVSNGASEPVTLSINYGPENINLTVNVAKEYYVEGSNISLSCSAVSRPAAQFYWLLNRDNLNDTGPELKLMNIQMSQSGNYSCQAFNNKTLRNETSQSSAVTVLERISGAAVTSSNRPIEEKSVNLTCDAAAGSISISISRLWKKNDLNLILADNMALYEENRVLSFKSLNKTDNGKYSCEISNPVSNDKAEYIMIVKYGPENVQIQGQSKIDFGKTLTLTCSAESEPSASYTWTLNGTEIHNSSVFTKVITGLSDSGNYTCQAMNKITERTLSAVHQVTVTGNPASPSVCSAGCIAGIVIVCLVVVGAAVGGIVYYISKRKKRPKTLSNSNTVTTRGGGQNNTGYSGSQELNYADVTIFQNRNGGRVHLGSQNETSDYAEVKTTSSAAGSTPPTCDDHMQRVKRQAPQPGGYGVNVYAQVKKN